MKYKGKILVIEDEDDINRLLCSILEDKGYEVTGVFSGTESLIYVNKYSWDMILLDLIIPGICGEELIVKIRKVTKSPIIVISAKSDRKTKLELLENGADDFIIKPFDPDEVVARVNVNIRRYIKKCY